MVGETVGTDYGGLLNRGSETCPEFLTTYWDYWHTMFESWEEDSWLEAKCDGGDSGGGGGDGGGGDGEVYEVCPNENMNLSLNVSRKNFFLSSSFSALLAHSVWSVTPPLPWTALSTAVPSIAIMHGSKRGRVTACMSVAVGSID